MNKEFILRLHSRQTDECFIVFVDGLPIQLYHDRIRLENDYNRLWNYSLTVSKKELNFRLKQLPNPETAYNFTIIK